MSARSAGRIAISQFILFAILTYTFITLGVTIEDSNGDASKRSLIAIGSCFASLVVLSLVLCFGILKNNVHVIRGWLFFNILITVVLFLILLAGAIYVSINIETYWSVLLCAMPFILIFWVAEGMIVVSSYLKKLQEKLKVLETV